MHGRLRRSAYSSLRDSTSVLKSRCVFELAIEIGGIEIIAPVLSDPQAVCAAAVMGVGVAVLAMSDVFEALRQGTLVRLLPQWYVDAGTISLYYPSRAQLPAKTRAFVDFVVESFEREGLARRLSAD